MREKMIENNKQKFYRKQKFQNDKKINMKRISQQINYPPLKTAKNLGSQGEFVRRENKRHLTTFQPGQKKRVQNDENESLLLKKNVFYTSTMVVNRLIDEIINSLSKDIQRIEIKKIIQSTINITNSITNQLYYMQNPQKSSNQLSPQAQKQPQKNQTDPISGFNKTHFVKRQHKTNKKHNSSSSNENSLIILHKQSQHSNLQPSDTQKKLPPLMKQLSQQKLQQFIPLDEISCVRNSNKKPSQDIQEVVRQRFLKQIENRKFKDKIEKINNTLIENGQSGNGSKRLKKNIGSRSAYDLNVSADRSNLMKEDCNFDYDGNKIQVASNSKPKSNLKILKPLYKLNKQKLQENKPSKLSKKYHERMSFVPRGSRNCLQFNSKTISDFDDTNYTLALKEKLQAQLKKTDIKFVEKQFLTKDKLNQQDKNKLNNRRQSLINLN